jgi:hypothetical protein
MASEIIGYLRVSTKQQGASGQGTRREARLCSAWTLGLGVILFQMVTGRRPFEGSLMQVRGGSSGYGELCTCSGAGDDRIKPGSRLARNPEARGMGAVLSSRLPLLRQEAAVWRPAARIAPVG